MALRKMFNPRTIFNALWTIWFIVEILSGHIWEGNALLSANTFLSIIGFCFIPFTVYFLLKNWKENQWKSYNEITSRNNVLNYLQVYFTLLNICQNIDNLHPIGTWLKVSLSTAGIAAMLYVIIREWTTHKKLLNAIIIGHVLLGYFTFNQGKHAFVSHYGNEKIGSFWSKPEFHTQYYVLLSNNSGNDDARKLPATVHVFSEAEEYDTGEQVRVYDVQYIILEKIRLPNGENLTFDDCELEFNKEYPCWDQYGRFWDVKLIDEKVE